MTYARIALLPLALAACSDLGNQDAAFNEADDELAKMALQALGADVDGAQPRRCQSCHSVSRAKVREWKVLTDAALASGCTPPTSRRYVYAPRGGDPATTQAELNPAYVDPMSDAMSQDQARKLVDCMRTEPGNPSSVFDPSRVGIDAITLHERNSHYARLFQKAYPDANEAKQQRGEAIRRIKMPRGALFQDTLPADPDPSYTLAIRKEDFWVVREWFDRGLPALEAQLPEKSGPTSCKPEIRKELSEHVRASARGGWTQKNALDGLTMYGCPGDTAGGWPDTALACLGDKEQAAEWQASYEGPAAGSSVRILTKLGYRTSFWTRSSADGRYVANGRSDGGTGGSIITDLLKNIDIPVRAAYDPGFTPDNATFVFQGTPVGAGFCPQDMLENPPMNGGQLVPITFQEPGCGGTNSIRLYQHLGTSLDGGAAFAVNGDYSSDNGGHSPSTTTDPSATAGPAAKVVITAIVRNGSGYDFREPAVRATPYEGDTAVSPSSTLVNSRIAGPEGKQLGVTIRKVHIAPGDDGFQVGLSEPSSYCVKGSKLTHSFDDRFIATHTYSDVGGEGKGDVYIVDLFDGQIYGVTNMPAGVFAVYPHFRSDGWLYFTVRDTTPPGDAPNVEYVAASDVALRVERAKPINEVVW